jgi:peptidyl-prolyl cis-trans isomerase D
LKSETTLPFTRIAFGAQSPIPQGLTPALFKLKPGGADMAPNQDGYAVGQLVEIQPADPAADKAGADEVGQEIRVSIAGDIIAEFTTALRARFPVSVNTRAIDDASEGRDVGQPPPQQR